MVFCSESDCVWVIYKYFAWCNHTLLSTCPWIKFLSTFFLFLIEFTGFADIIYVFIIRLRTRDIYYADRTHLQRPLPPSVEINFLLVFRYHLPSHGQFILSHEIEMEPFFFLFFFFVLVFFFANCFQFSPAAFIFVRDSHLC